MADFLPAYEKMIVAEGGYRLHKVEGDRGGQTYAGIARRSNPGWPGWAALDAGSEPPASLVRDFYAEHYWRPIGGDRIRDQSIAETIFDFGVNGGVKPAAKLAQAVVGATPDGVIGDKTIAALNLAEPALFRAAYALAKIKRYAEIVTRDRTQAKFLLGWINRTLKGLA